MGMGGKVVKIRILVAEGDRTIRNELKALLLQEGYEVDAVADGISALKYFRRYEYHLMIVDSHLPELDWKIVCRQIRKMSDLPFVILSTDADEESKLKAYELGAEDYIIKPFSYKELLARLNVILRRTVDKNEISERNLIFDGLFIDTVSHTVYVDDQKIDITPKAYQLLLILAENPNQVFSREMLLNKIWGQDYNGTDRTVDAHIKMLREALGPRQYYIATVRGFGYKFDEVYR